MIHLSDICLLSMPPVTATALQALLIWPWIKGPFFLKQQLYNVIFLWRNPPWFPNALRIKFKLLGRTCKALYGFVSPTSLVFTLTWASCLIHHSGKVPHPFLHSVLSWKSVFCRECPALQLAPHSQTFPFLITKSFSFTKIPVHSFFFLKCFILLPPKVK